jgi:hypothetical protein
MIDFSRLNNLTHALIHDIYLLTPFRSVKHSTRTVAVPSAQGRTVRARAGRSAAWCEARWYSLRRGGLSAAWCATRASLPDGRTVHALGARRSARTQRRRESPAAPGSRSQEGPRRGGEILGGV